jgi:hypothetical protein
MDATDGHDLVPFVEPFPEFAGFLLPLHLGTDDEQVHDEQHHAQHDEETEVGTPSCGGGLKQSE